MNQDQINTIKRLNFENIIWVIFIIISALDIYGDELIKKNIIYNDKSSETKATNIFLILTVVSLLIYLYFLKRNYNDFNKYKNKDYEIRFIGSIFILIGTLCFLYFQIDTRNQNDSLSNV